MDDRGSRQPAGIGHNGGPSLQEDNPGEASWRLWCWRAAYKKAWSAPREVTLRRLERAEELGRTYCQYTLENLKRGTHGMPIGQIRVNATRSNPPTDSGTPAGSMILNAILKPGAMLAGGAEGAMHPIEAGLAAAGGLATVAANRLLRSVVNSDAYRNRLLDAALNPGQQGALLKAAGTSGRGVQPYVTPAGGDALRNQISGEARPPVVIHRPSTPQAAAEAASIPTPV